MTIPQFLFRELNERFEGIDPPSHGKIVIKVEMHYLDNLLAKTQLAAYAEETLR